jgi:hypothetical protein
MARGYRPLTAAAAREQTDRRVAIAGLVLGLVLAAGCGGDAESALSTTEVTDASSAEITATESTAAKTQSSAVSEAKYDPDNAFHHNKNIPPG